MITTTHLIEQQGAIYLKTGVFVVGAGLIPARDAGKLRCRVKREEAMGKIKYPFIILAGLSAAVALILALTGAGRNRVRVAGSVLRGSGTRAARLRHGFASARTQVCWSNATAERVPANSRTT